MKDELKVGKMIITKEGYEARVVSDYISASYKLQNTVAIELQDKERTKVLMRLDTFKCVQIPEKVIKELSKHKELLMEA